MKFPLRSSNELQTDYYITVGHITERIVRWCSSLIVHQQYKYCLQIEKQYKAKFTLQMTLKSQIRSTGTAIIVLQRRPSTSGVVYCITRPHSPGKNIRYPLENRLVWLQDQCGGLLKTSPLSGFYPRADQPVENCYNDWAVLTTLS